MSERRHDALRRSTRPTPRELVGRLALVAIWLAAETLLLVERLAVRTTERRWT